jgi:hypothetical protein
MIATVKSLKRTSKNPCPFAVGVVPRDQPLSRNKLSALQGVCHIPHLLDQVQERSNRIERAKCGEGEHFPQCSFSCSTKNIIRL